MHLKLWPKPRSEARKVMNLRSRHFNFDWRPYRDLSMCCVGTAGAELDSSPPLRPYTTATSRVVVLVALVLRIEASAPLIGSDDGSRAHRQLELALTQFDRPIYSKARSRSFGATNGKVSFLFPSFS